MDKELFPILKRMAAFDEDRVVLHDMVSGRKYTGSEFAALVYAMAADLRENIREEILVCEDNCAELVLLYFAGMLAGKIIIPLDPEKEDGEIDRIRRLHQEAVFWERGELRRLFAQINAAVAAPNFSWQQMDGDKTFLITYTSGSTGIPKGVHHTVRNLLIAAYAFGTTMAYDGDTVLGHCMPMTYMAGILNTIILPYIMGGTVVLLPRFSVKNALSFWGQVKLAGINTLWLAPTMLRILHLLDKRAEMKEYFHQNAMKISVGTAPLDKKLRDDFEGKYGIRLYQSYGLSETLFISTEVPEEMVSRHTVGRLLPGVEIACETDGEILIHVPWMFLGYTNADTAAYMEAGWYVSGDLGEMTAEGNLLITGRKKELIVKGGYNINPRDIENVLMEKRVGECAVFALHKGGEELIACAYACEREISLLEINREIERALGKHHKVDVLERMTAIPKNLNGKIDKLATMKWVEEKYDSKV